MCDCEFVCVRERDRYGGAVCVRGSDWEGGYREKVCLDVSVMSYVTLARRGKAVGGGLAWQVCVSGQVCERVGVRFWLED